MMTMTAELPADHAHRAVAMERYYLNYPDGSCFPQLEGSSLVQAWNRMKMDGSYAALRAHRDVFVVLPPHSPDEMIVH